MNSQQFESSLIEINKGVLPFQHGLTNFGNTCYANSVLQCLFGDAKLCNLVLNPENGHINNKPGFELVNGLSKLIKACFGNREKEIKVEVSNIIEIVYNNSGLFERGQQSDANEFLIYLLNTLKDSFASCSELVFPGKSAFTTCFDEYLIGIKQTMVCEYGHASERCDRTMLSLNIDHKTNIGDCLNDYFGGSHLQRCICAGLMHNPNNNACNSYKCEKCQMHVGAKQTLAVNWLPEKLVLHLKRFRFNGREV